MLLKVALCEVKSTTRRGIAVAVVPRIAGHIYGTVIASLQTKMVELNHLFGKNYRTLHQSEKWCPKGMTMLEYRRLRLWQ
jgi:hypothetical protein